MDRRSALRAATVAVGASLAGCAAPLAGRRSTPDTPADGPVVEAGPGDYPHEILADNDRPEPVEFTLAVRRDRETLYEADHRVPADTSRAVAGFTRRTLPSDDQSVRVVVRTAGGPTRRLDFRVDECHGDVLVRWRPEGPSMTYSVC